MDTAPRDANWKPQVRKYFVARLLSNTAIQMQSVAIGWQIYDLTKRPMDLGFAGLVQFLPIIFLSLPAGSLADRYSRKKISTLCLVVAALGAGWLFTMNLTGKVTVGAIFFALFIEAIARAFMGAANQALLAQLCPTDSFTKVVAIYSSLWQFSTILGPTLGGLLYSYFKQPLPVYGLTLLSLVLSIFSMASVTVLRPQAAKTPLSVSTLFSGVRYVFHKRTILGSLSLDLFAVLLGGSVALLPIFASDLLHVGPKGLGLLRSCPGLGAALMALYLARNPIQTFAGRKMFLAVLVFGVATIGFGLSNSFIVSAICLFVTGAADIVSVVIRHSLVQLQTPESMRGRVSAVNLVFISASNELGEFESGLVASWCGPVASVVIGGVGTVAVALIWAKLFPELRNLNELPRET